MITQQTNQTAPGRMTRVRWWILALLFLGTTLNFLDRMVMGIVAPGVQKEYFISDIQYSYIQSAFAMSYAFCQVLSGRMLDWIGTRTGYALALAAWSLSSMGHAFSRGALSFCFMRGVLGISESPAFPAAAKAVAEWFPRRERAFAVGFINAGTNMGVIFAAAVVPWLAGTYGWQWSFIVTGALGFVVLALWIPLYKKPAEHPEVSAAELAHINSDPPEATIKLRWLTLIRCPQAWAFASGKFLTDSMWWFYVTWFPKYLNDRYGVNLSHIGLPLVVIYVICSFGSIGGGGISSLLIKRGATVNRSRKTALFVSAMFVMPVFFVQNIPGLWPSVLVLGLITAGHQGFSSNLYTLVSDMFPRQAVASVAGFGGMCGYGGASLFQIVVGRAVQKDHDYTVPFVCSGLAYLIALAVIHLLVPKLEPARLGAADELHPSAALRPTNRR
jgi:ACS family hexuronate transporter-like MFS transporter